MVCYDAMVGPEPSYEPMRWLAGKLPYEGIIAFRTEEGMKKDRLNICPSKLVFVCLEGSGYQSLSFKRCVTERVDGLEIRRHEFFNDIHFIVAAGENKITETGMRPGFVLTASNGKTIEINNTDSDGGLTLADALVYACNLGVDKIVDLAASNGACVAALGPLIAGIFTPNDELSNEVVAASEVAGEQLWRLPMEESYGGSKKSVVADTINTGGSLFLKQFVDEKVQWLHVDMTGPVWNTKKEAATGFATHSLVEWVLSNSSS